jgi:hypothetical protein
MKRARVALRIDYRTLDCIASTKEGLDAAYRFPTASLPEKRMSFSARDLVFAGTQETHRASRRATAQQPEGPISPKASSKVIRDKEAKGGWHQSRSTSPPKPPAYLNHQSQPKGGWRQSRAKPQSRGTRTPQKAKGGWHQSRSTSHPKPPAYLNHQSQPKGGWRQ